MSPLWFKCRPIFRFLIHINKNSSYFGDVFFAATFAVSLVYGYKNPRTLLVKVCEHCNVLAKRPAEYPGQMGRRKTIGKRLECPWWTSQTQQKTFGLCGVNVHHASAPSVSLAQLAVLRRQE
jgi:hypothetical protein